MKEALENKVNLKTKPVGSLGKLEKIAIKVGTIQNTLTPQLTNPTMLIFAADHGLADEGVSAFPKEVTFQMVMNFLSGGAAINIFCKVNDINLKVVDAGVDYDFPVELDLIHAKVANGSQNMMKEPAMSSKTCNEAMDKGAALVRLEKEAGCNVIGFGEMGIGNTASAALLMHKYTGIPIAECTGPGTGHTAEGLSKKIQILTAVSGKYDLKNPFDILCTVGGLEIAMMTGAMLEAAKLGMVVLVDGFICTSAMLAASKINVQVLDNAIFCHVSEEKGHKMMLDYLNAEPIVNLGMRLGEGSGVAVTYPIIKASVAFLNEMASFEDAGVSNK